MNRNNLDELTAILQCVYSTWDLGPVFFPHVIMLCETIFAMCKSLSLWAEYCSYHL